MQAYTNNLSLPWTDERAENKRFRVILAILILAGLLLAIWIPMIDLPEPEREELEELPPQLAKFIATKPKPVIPAA